MMINSNMIHIWPEAYIENIGWIPFEPSGGFVYGSGWSLFDDPGGYTYEIPDEYFPEVEALPKEDYVPLSKPQESKKIYWSIIGGLLLIIILSIVLIIPISLLVIHSKYQNAEMPDKIRILSKRNLKILHLLNFNMNEGETLTELHTDNHAFCICDCSFHR